MSYLNAVPAYEYELPCGHVFRSLTPSVEGDSGRHWFYCRPCKEHIGIPDAYMYQVERRPLRANGRAYGDGQIARLIDAAITCDRIARHYAAVWDGQTVEEVQHTLGVSHRLVKRVAVDLGVYERATEYRP